MKRFCKLSAPVIVAAIMVFVSAVPVFAEGLTTSQATSIYTELTSLSGNYIKSFLFNIQRSLTATASNGVLYELQRISSSLRGSGSDGHPAQLWSLLDRALYGNHDLLGSGWQGMGWYLYDIDNKIASSLNLGLTSGFYTTGLAGREDARDNLSSLTYTKTSSGSYPLILNTSPNNPQRLYYAESNTVPTTFGDWFNTLNTNLVTLGFRFYGRGADYYSHVYDYDNMTDNKYIAVSMMDIFDNTLGSISNSAGRLSAFFVDEDELQAKKDNKDVIEGAVQGFLTPGESASVSASGVVELKGNFDALQNGFGSSAAASDSFSVLSSGSETYSWFSQSTANDLDSVESGSTLRALGSETPALDQYYQNVLFGIHYFD